MEKNTRITKHCECVISKTIKSKAYVCLDNKENIMNIEPYGKEEILNTEIIEYIGEMTPGDHLLRDIEIALEVARSAINRYGEKFIELLINKEEDEIYVHYHSTSNSTALYVLEYSANDKFVVEYIKNKFEKADINICEY